MKRPRLLDLFAGAGGAGRGYQLAGFHVTAVDTTPQPNHCADEFVQADAFDVLADRRFMARFDAVHASPPCQHHANVTNWRGSADDHADLLTPTLAWFRTHVMPPWVVENVPEALTGWDLLLCGSQFGLNVRRHRGFVAPWLPFLLLPPCHHPSSLLAFEHKQERAYAVEMGVPWMTNREARQAIPPAYTHLIGTHLLEHIGAKVGTA